MLSCRKLESGLVNDPHQHLSESDLQHLWLLTLLTLLILGIAINLVLAIIFGINILSFLILILLVGFSIFGGIFGLLASLWL